jgi:light-regulated signal transduction histidine kinase (bacteriophytochrome)
MLKAIQSGAARMNQLIEDLLDLSQLGAQDIRRAHVDMNRLVAEVLYELPDSAKHVAQITVADLHAVEADPALLRQVLINLLSNAVKYSAKQKSPQISIESRLTAEGIVYSVRDNGVGFDMAYADKLFGAFQRMHKASEFDGTGVGLAIVQRVIHKHGGEVWAEAEPEKGATFYFSLPV